MSWRVILWFAAALLLVLLAGSAAVLAGSVRSWVRVGERSVGRACAILLSASLLAGSLYGFWFLSPVVWGRRAVPGDRAMAESLGKGITFGKQSVLVVVAHPDDAEWYAGGSLILASRAGSNVTLVVATDGERGRGGYASTLGLTRRGEQIEGARLMGCSGVVFLGLRDRGLRGEPELKAKIARVFEEVRPDIVVTFDAENPARPYVHPDHQAVGWAVLDIVRQGFDKPVILYLFSTAKPNAAVDITSAADAKAAAVSAHATQFGGSGGRRALDGNRAWGESMGWAYAEMFRVLMPKEKQ